MTQPRLRLFLFNVTKAVIAKAKVWTWRLCQTLVLAWHRGGAGVRCDTTRLNVSWQLADIINWQFTIVVGAAASS